MHRRLYSFMNLISFQASNGLLESSNRHFEVSLRIFKSMILISTTLEDCNVNMLVLMNFTYNKRSCSKETGNLSTYDDNNGQRMIILAQNEHITKFMQQCIVCQSAKQRNKLKTPISILHHMHQTTYRRTLAWTLGKDC